MKLDNQFLKKFINAPNTKLLLDTIFDAIYIVDTTRTIQYWNKGAEKLTGFTRNEVINKKCADNILNHIDENGKLLCRSNCPLVGCMKNDIEVSEKVYPQRKDKSRFPTLTNISPIKNNHGEIVGAIEVFRDITNDEEFKTLQQKFDKLVQKYISNTAYKEIKNQLTEQDSSTSSYKKLTILYLDIVNFTSISEQLTPAKVAEMLNDVFGICDVITRENQGDIDKFIGDAVMATYIDANDAVNSAKKILNALDSLNRERNAENQTEIQVRIGINTGSVMQVEIGTQDRKDFTVIGDTVNTASRIESISEPNSIFISASTYLKLKDNSNFEFIGNRLFKGKNELIGIYKYC